MSGTDMRKIINLMENATEQETLVETVGGNYLYHATRYENAKEILKSGYIKPAGGPQDATLAQTEMPTVCLTRSWDYAIGKKDDNGGHVGHEVVFIFDRDKLEQNHKTLATSQSPDIRGSAYANPSKVRQAKLAMASLDLNKDGIVDQDEVAKAKAKAKTDCVTKLLIKKYFKSHAGGEFEEAVPVRGPGLQLKGIVQGFWINPTCEEALKDSEFANHQLRITGDNTKDNNYNIRK